MSPAPEPCVGAHPALEWNRDIGMEWGHIVWLTFHKCFNRKVVPHTSFKANVVRFECLQLSLYLL